MRRLQIKEVSVINGVLQVKDKHLFLSFRKGGLLIGVENILTDAKGIELYFSDYGFFGLPAEYISEKDLRSGADYVVALDETEQEKYDRAIILSIK